MRSPPSRAASLSKIGRRSTGFRHEESSGRWLVASAQPAILDAHKRESKTDDVGRAAPMFETRSQPALAHPHPHQSISYVTRRARSVRLFSFSAFSTGAFTLIEMIVVMLIIATLAALVMGAATTVFDRARRAQAKNDVIQIATAVNAFYTEYGRYPVNITAPTNDAFFGTGTTPAGCTSYGDNDVLLDVLRSNTDPSGPNLATVNLLNPRRIAFLTPSSAKTTTPPRGGIAPDRRYYDPWGSEYAVQIDTNYDNTVSNPYSDSDGSAGTNPIRQGVIAYSYGKSGAIGGGAAASSTFASESGSSGVFKGSSDVISW